VVPEIQLAGLPTTVKPTKPTASGMHMTESEH
jgi:hypothetical protein